MTERISLRKGKAVSFDKRRIHHGPLTVHSGWERVPNGYDLDLDAMWRDRHGNKDVVQALGRNFGSYHSSPYLQLSGDDRFGGVGETITGNTEYILSELEWIGFGLLNYGSRRPLSKVRGAVTTVRIPGLPEMVIEHDEQHTSVCSILQIHVTDGELRVQNDLRALHYGWFWPARSQEKALDRYWGVGLEWHHGTKEPR